MVQIKEINISDIVELRTSEKTWKGRVLESYDAETILLKLDSGYNIGIKERDILEATILEKSKDKGTKITRTEKNSQLPNIAMIITGGTISVSYTHLTLPTKRIV